MTLNPSVRHGAEKTATLLVHDWNCQCGGCGYGGSSWIDSPALKDKPILVQDSESCPGCGARFIARRLGPEARKPAVDYEGDYGEAA